MCAYPWMETAWGEAGGSVAVHGPYVARVMEISGIRYNLAIEGNERSWLEFGDDLSGPIPGCLVIFERGGGEGVGFVVADDGNRLHVLGKDQDNTVRVLTCRKVAVLGYRWPSGYPKPGPKPMLKSRTVWATVTTTAATIAGGANVLSDAGSAVRDAASNVSAAAIGILGMPVWLWPLIGVIAGAVILLLLWQDRRQGGTS